MWYECQWDNSPSKSQFVKVDHYRSKYGFQHSALVHTEQQATKCPKKFKKHILYLYSEIHKVDIVTDLMIILATRIEKFIVFLNWIRSLNNQKLTGWKKFRVAFGRSNSIYIVNHCMSTRGEILTQTNNSAWNIKLNVLIKTIINWSCSNTTVMNKNSTY